MAVAQVLEQGRQLEAVQQAPRAVQVEAGLRLLATVRVEQELVAHAHLLRLRLLHQHQLTTLAPGWSSTAAASFAATFARRPLREKSTF